MAELPALDIGECGFVLGHRQRYRHDAFADEAIGKKELFHPQIEFGVAFTGLPQPPRPRSGSIRRAASNNPRISWKRAGVIPVRAPACACSYVAVADVAANLSLIIVSGFAAKNLSRFSI